MLHSAICTLHELPEYDTPLWPPHLRTHCSFYRKWSFLSVCQASCCSSAKPHLLSSSVGYIYRPLVLDSRVMLHYLCVTTSSTGSHGAIRVRRMCLLIEPKFTKPLSRLGCKLSTGRNVKKESHSSFYLVLNLVKFYFHWFYCQHWDCQYFYFHSHTLHFPQPPDLQDGWKGNSWWEEHDYFWDTSHTLLP